MIMNSSTNTATSTYNTMEANTNETNQSNELVNTNRSSLANISANTNGSNAGNAGNAGSLDIPASLLGKFTEYHNQLEIPEIAGTRIVKCLYQINKKLGLDSKGNGRKDKESVYTRIPTNHITESKVLDSGMINKLAPYIVTWLQGVEETMIKADHKKGLEFIYTDGLSIDKLILELDRLDLGSKLTIGIIEDWFGAVIEESLLIRFIAKLGINDSSSEAELNKLETIMQAYKAKFCLLASAKKDIKVADYKSMLLITEMILTEVRLDPSSSAYTKYESISNNIISKLKLGALEVKDSELLESL